MYLHYNYFLHHVLNYINLHYLQYIYNNTVTLVKFNYSWSIYHIIVCMLIVE